VQLYLDGRFKLDEMVTKTYPLSDIGEAIADLHDGKLNRGVLRIA
jgi:S-(hydroxymethyl)glutathione dehydrogenase/alcohol dehydrogenase